MQDLKTTFGKPYSFPVEGSPVQTSLFLGQEDSIWLVGKVTKSAKDVEEDTV